MCSLLPDGHPEYLLEFQAKSPTIQNTQHVDNIIMFES